LDNEGFLLSEPLEARCHCLDVADAGVPGVQRDALDGYRECLECRSDAGAISLVERRVGRGVTRSTGAVGVARTA